MPVDHEQTLLDTLEGVGQKTVEAASAPVDTASAVTVQNFWRHPDAHPVVLDLLMLRQYGPEWMLWEPETLQVLIPDDFKTQVLSELNLAKLQACKVLHLVDSFWQRWEVFVACTMPFNDVFPDFEMMQVPTVAQCLVSADIAARIRDDVAWSEEMKTYFAEVYDFDGVLLPLPPLDGIKLPKVDGLNADDLAFRWAEVRGSGHPPTGQTIIDEQLRRLHVVWGFLEESRTRLRQQLGLHHA